MPEYVDIKWLNVILHYQLLIFLYIIGAEITITILEKLVSFIATAFKR